MAFTSPEPQRNAHAAALFAPFARHGGKQALVFEIIDVQFVRMGFQPRALFALIARNEFAAVGKTDDVHVAVGRAPAAHTALGCVRKIFEFGFGGQ